MNDPSLASASQAQEVAQSATQTQLPLAPLHLPAEPGLWPLAWGWWAILALVVLTILIMVLLYKRHKKRRLAKKTVLRLLKQTTRNQAGNKKVATVNDLLRQVCLSYYPRPMLASLHGERWYAFLDDQHPSNKSNFQVNQHDWQQALYQKDGVSDELANQLYQQVEDWITHSLPPSKKKLKAANLAFQKTASTFNNGLISSARAVKTTPKALIEKESQLKATSEQDTNTLESPSAESESKNKESKNDV
ncbi:DUF4381 domain-containing protein [Vibrio rumoiensis]|uniref:DUF4381 domain-containing protein n=1 Tax=Vibrio rumoiensis 1S-45 TaxID=1188252 RepID=A0A1E5DZC7_9VIBR|nr:DUF4381 domain-containing protein [Vibrio rumoiensis]OEF23289.1 hypothetical protein A1QC_12365 [Vibrio rumoiensis 1S-45]